MNKLIKYSALGVGIFWLYNKWSKTKNAFNLLTADITGISDISISQGSIICKIDVKITNPTDLPLHIPGGKIATLERVNFYTNKGAFIGSAIPSFTEFELDANSTKEIKDIPAAVPSSNLLTLLGQLSNYSSLRHTVEIKIFGQTLLIK